MTRTPTATPNTKTIAASQSQIVLDYLEKIARESFEREIGQDETVWRALPFFAAGLGFIITFIGTTGTKVPATLPHVYVLWSLCLVTLSVVFMLISGCYIWMAAISRVYRRPSYETETKKWSEDLRKHHSILGLTGEDLESAVLFDLKEHTLSEFSEAATQNRQVNYEKVYARGRAMLFFLLAAAVAGLLSATIFVHDSVLPVLAAIESKEAAVTRQPVKPPSGDKKIPAPTIVPPAASSKPPAPKSVMVVEHAGPTGGKK